MQEIINLYSLRSMEVKVKVRPLADELWQIGLRDSCVNEIWDDKSVLRFTFGIYRAI